MSKSGKTQRLREKMQADVKQSKQKTLDSVGKAPKNELIEAAIPEKKKQIVISGIDTVTKEDELDLKVEFRLFPSKAAFSRIKVDLFFDEQKLSAASIRIPQSPLGRENFEFSPVLDMKGIAAGLHAIKVEMYELWGSGEKLTCTSKEATIKYIPVKREDRLIKVPIVKSVAGADLVVVSDSEKDVYRELEESMKKEEISKRDEW